MNQGDKEPEHGQRRTGDKITLDELEQIARFDTPSRLLDCHQKVGKSDFPTSKLLLSI